MIRSFISVIEGTPIDDLNFGFRLIGKIQIRIENVWFWISYSSENYKIQFRPMWQTHRKIDIETATLGPIIVAITQHDLCDGDERVCRRLAEWRDGGHESNEREATLRSSRAMDEEAMVSNV